MATATRTGKTRSAASTTAAGRSAAKAGAASPGTTKGRARGKGAKDAAMATAPADASTATNAGSGYTTPAKVTVTAGATPRATRSRPSEAARAARRVAELLKTIGDPSRLEVIRHLSAEGEANVGQMSQAFGRSQPSLSHSLGILRRSGVVEFRREGKTSRYSLAPTGEKIARMVRELETTDPS